MRSLGSWGLAADLPLPPREQGTHPANVGLLDCWGEYLAPVEREDNRQWEGYARQAS